MCSVSAVAELLSVDNALRLVLEHARPLPAEDVPIAAAAGRVLAEDAAAVIDLPPFPSSAMDGFALRAADTPATLPVVARIAAGDPAPRGLAPGESMGIATGGVVPDGADAVVPIELVTDRGDTVIVPAPVPSGDNVRPRAGDVRAGDPVLRAGTVVTPARLAALAASGVATLRCVRRPRATVVATGTELRRPGEPLADGQIYESNGAMLTAMLRDAGAVVEGAVWVADDEASHETAIARGLEDDLLVTSGGVSVGPHDLVRPTIARLGATEVFWGVAMRPGKPLSFAIRGDTLAFGLPGNPVSSLVGALLFVQPAVRALQGVRDPAPRFATGVLGAPARRGARRDDYQRARLEREGDVVVLHPVSGQESHMIVRASVADALVHIPRGEGELPAGSSVRYLPLDRATGA